MKQNVSGPYQVDDSVMEAHETLDATDYGAWYILINGSMQFVSDERHGRWLIDLLTKLE